MDLPVSWLTWGGAALPIVLLLVLLVRYSWSAVDAAAVGLVCAGGVAAWLYKAPLCLIAGELSKGVWNSVTIMLVIFPAILIYEVSHTSGTFAAVQRDITRLIPDKLLQVLAIGWCFSSFLQGPSGFGVPVAVSAPLLISIGVRPLWAVAVPLLGHAWGNTFGTLALAWEALVQQGQLSAAMELETAWWAGIFTWMLNLLAGLVICWLYRGAKGLRHGLPAVLALSLCMGGGQLLLSQVSPTLAVVIPSSMALLLVFALARLPRYSVADAGNSPIIDPVFSHNRLSSPMSLNQAMAPYSVLVGLSVLVLLTPPVRAAFAQWSTAFAFPATRSGYNFINPAYALFSPIVWLTHSGFFLLVSALIPACYFYRKGFLPRSALGGMLARTLHKAVPASLSVAFLIAMSKLMAGSGQTSVLAAGTALVAGNFYGLMAPAVGMLGSFMSSSNVSSNILFCSFQQSMASLTGLSEVLVLAAQTSGAAIGTMFSPPKVLLGTTTAGISGADGEIIKKLLPIALLAALLMGFAVSLAG